MSLDPSLILPSTQQSHQQHQVRQTAAMSYNSAEVMHTPAVQLGPVPTQQPIMQSNSFNIDPRQPTLLSPQQSQPSLADPNHAPQPTYTMLLDADHMENTNSMIVPTSLLEPVHTPQQPQQNASWSTSAGVFTQLNSPEQSTTTLIKPKEEFVKPKVHALCRHTRFCITTHAMLYSCV